MTQMLLFPNSEKEIVKYYRTKLAKLSQEQVQSYQLASFQIIRGKFKQYVEYDIKETKDGLKCTKKILWYIQVPNTSLRARKENVFVYMDADLRKKYHKKESSKIMDLKDALKEINAAREKKSPNYRVGVRAY